MTYNPGDKIQDAIFGDAARRRDQLIKQNEKAPADQIIRAIFKHFDNVRDDDEPADSPEGLILDAGAALDLWYGVDELTLVFDKKGTDLRPGYSHYFVRLIHQRSMNQPHIEDLSDYTASLDGTELGPLLGDGHYDHIYTA